MSPSSFCGLGQFFARVRNFGRKPKEPEVSQLRIGSPYDFRRVVHFGSPGEDGTHVITVNGQVTSMDQLLVNINAHQN